MLIPSRPFILSFLNAASYSHVCYTPSLPFAQKPLTINHARAVRQLVYPIVSPSFKQTCGVQIVCIPYASNNSDCVSRDAPRTTRPIDLVLCVPPVLPSLKISSVVDPIHPHPYAHPHPNSFRRGRTSWEQGRPSFACFMSGSYISLLADVLPRACPRVMSL